MSRDTLPGIKQFDLSGKVALVTGGSKGLGLAMAAGLASAGARIMLVNRNSDEGNQAAKDLAADFGVEVKAFSADVGCKVDDNVLIGMGAIVMDGAIIGSHSVIAAGAVVREHPYGAPLPRVSKLSGEDKLAVEEDNIVKCLAYSKDRLGLV